MVAPISRTFPASTTMQKMLHVFLQARVIAILTALNAEL